VDSATRRGPGLKRSGLAAGANGQDATMTHPQQPELHRSEKGANVQDAKDSNAAEGIHVADPGRPHGVDKGNKGGGKGGGVPPEQQSPHPS
jgi:hypothetical protein